MPSPIASRMGKANVQKTASGSRRNSRSRTLVSSRNEECTLTVRRPSVAAPSSPRWRSTFVSGFTELPSGEMDENVFERGRVRGELGKLELSFGERREQCGNRAVELTYLELVFVVDDPCFLHT